MDGRLGVFSRLAPTFRWAESFVAKVSYMSRKTDIQRVGGRIQQNGISRLCFSAYQSAIELVLPPQKHAFEIRNKL